MFLKERKGSGLLGRRLQGARQAAFVGREEELAVFDAALYGGSCSVLFVHGPGGIGKSALLRCFAQEAAAAGRSVSTIDGRTITVSPEVFEAEAAPVLDDERAVLLIDAFERIQGLEGWLHERFLPRLPEGVLVVVAGRIPPDMIWQADPGWADMLRVMTLRELAPDDARALMQCRGVAADLHEPLLAFAGGHPLALALGAAAAVKDYQAGSRWRPDQNVVATLLEQLIGEVPSAAHRRALQVCARAYITTEALLRAVMPDEVTPDDGIAPLFAWLRRLPFVESTATGLFPHDVVREVLEADLRWRDPHGHADVHQRIHAHLAGELSGAADSDVPAAVGSLFFLNRDHELTSGYRTWSGRAEVHEDLFMPQDMDALIQVATAGDNEESAAAAVRWARCRPQTFRLYRRTATGEPVAFFAWLRLERPDENEIAADPIIATAWTHARATTPLRAGEHLAVGRIWTLPAHRGSSPVMDLIHRRAIGHCLRADRMAWSYLAMRDPDDCAAQLRHYNMHDIDERPRLGELPYGLFVHDWRAVPPTAWLERLNRLPLSGSHQHTGEPEPELAVLSREEFHDAVRSTLRLLSQPSALAASPLAHTRLVTEHPVSDPGIALRNLLQEQINQLNDDPRAIKLHRALDITFLRGAPTQELAAERLHLPFTTYRRHLRAGIERVCADLWHRELYGHT
ncbi:ATP-binding protein [Nonomuraea sp. NBC_00507]|uniref:ATP-binding protein n=1 Tax=Nonomuraea sp. NBC_00507 TaxID=2976002 RepID=UPI002E17BBD6